MAYICSVKAAVLRDWTLSDLEKRVEALERSRASSSEGEEL